MIDTLEDKAPAELRIWSAARQRRFLGRDQVPRARQRRTWERAWPAHAVVSAHSAPQHTALTRLSVLSGQSGADARALHIAQATPSLPALPRLIRPIQQRYRMGHLYLQAGVLGAVAELHLANGAPTSDHLGVRGTGVRHLPVQDTHGHLVVGHH